jgi:phage baseplate assembly protein V
MFTISDFKRFIKPIQKKIYLMVGRALLLAVTNSGKYQVVKVSVNSGEIFDDVERMQEYGLDSYPAVTSTSEALCVSPNGNRERAIILKIQDREKRPTDLAEGEVALYTDEDSGGNHRIHMKNGKDIDIIGAAINVNGTTITITGTGAISINGTTIELAGGALPPIGVVTGQCICAFTGNVHPDISTTVTASK